jgi:tetratricopeptide (TPR) repeat protein
MKNLITTLFLAVVCSTGFAQVKAPQPSPKAVIAQTVGLTDVTIDYSRPSAKGRTIFGDLVPFGKLWRTGANANSIITFSDDVMIDGKTLPKGKYAIYTIPKADNWDVIFYKDTDNWGTPESFDEAKVALKTTAKPQMLNNRLETFTIAMNNLDNNFGHLEISWEKTLVAVKIEVPTNKTTMASIDKALNGPTAADYYAAGTYYFQSNGDMKKALEYVDRALNMNEQKPFWQLRQKSLIQAKLGDKKGAIETAKLSLGAAEAAKNNDYVKMNKDSIAEWSKK